MFPKPCHPCFPNPMRRPQGWYYCDLYWFHLHMHMPHGMCPCKAPVSNVDNTMVHFALYIIVCKEDTLSCNGQVDMNWTSFPHENVHNVYAKEQ